MNPRNVDLRCPIRGDHKRYALIGLGQIACRTGGDDLFAERALGIYGFSWDMESMRPRNGDLRCPIRGEHKCYALIGLGQTVC